VPQREAGRPWSTPWAGAATASTEESTARELTSLGQGVLDEFGGHAARLRDGADTKRAVAGRVQDFSGIGPAAADIFVREITPVWGL